MVPIRVWNGTAQVCVCVVAHNPAPKGLIAWCPSVGRVVNEDDLTWLTENSLEGVHWLCPTTAHALERLMEELKATGNEITSAMHYRYTLYVRTLAQLTVAAVQGQPIADEEAQRMLRRELADGEVRWKTGRIDLVDAASPAVPAER